MCAASLRERFIDMKEKFPIDLGRKFPGPSDIPLNMDSDDKHYPTLYLEWEESYDLPKEGILVAKYRTVRESSSKPKDGKERHSLDLEILEIKDAKPSKKSKSKSEESADEALDRLRKESEKDYE